MRIRPNTWDNEIVQSVLVDNEYGLPDDMHGMTVLDIGAHIGSFAVACQKRNAKQVICYEPDPENVQVLAFNVEEDVESKTHITVYENAVTGN